MGIVFSSADEARGESGYGEIDLRKRNKGNHGEVNPNQLEPTYRNQAKG